MSNVDYNCEERLWYGLKASGLNDYAAAGVMGNIYAESGFRSNNLQDKFNTSLNMTDDEYVAAIDNGKYKNFVYDSAGFGLAQWTYRTRKQALLRRAASKKVSIADPDMQVKFLIEELAGYKNVMNVLKNATSIREASDAVLIHYEAPLTKYEKETQELRAEYGTKIYNKYVTKTADTGDYPDCPFTVKVLVDDLNYRSEASMNGKVLGQTGQGTFTITEVADGWGKLKSGAGWIYLGNSSYCEIGETIDEQAHVFKPYRIKVTIRDLNIRSGAGTEYQSVRICTPGVYTIVEEADGNGATRWGKLKSGIGWVSLDYVSKL